MNNDLQIAEDLNAGADYLRANGWLQNSAGFRGGPACLVGALCFVDVDGAAWGPTMSSLTNALRGTWPAHWNDVPGRTAEEVIELLESVALQHQMKALAETTPTAAAPSLEPVRA